MTPNDIIPGQKYRNKQYPKLTYLGAQKFNCSEWEEGLKPILVIIERGSIVYDVDPHSASSVQFWNDFYPIPKRKKAKGDLISLRNPSF